MCPASTDSLFTTSSTATISKRELTKNLRTVAFEKFSARRLGSPHYDTCFSDAADSSVNLYTTCLRWQHLYDIYKPCLRKVIRSELELESVDNPSPCSRIINVLPEGPGCCLSSVLDLGFTITLLTLS